MREEVYRALQGQGFTYEEAQDIYQEILESMREVIDEGGDPEEVLFDYGLEPDYLLHFLLDI